MFTKWDQPLKVGMRVIAKTETMPFLATVTDCTETTAHVCGGYWNSFTIKRRSYSNSTAENGRFWGENGGAGYLLVEPETNKQTEFIIIVADARYSLQPIFYEIKNSDELDQWVEIQRASPVNQLDKAVIYEVKNARVIKTITRVIIEDYKPTETTETPEARPVTLTDRAYISPSLRVLDPDELAEE